MSGDEPIKVVLASAYAVEQPGPAAAALVSAADQGAPYRSSYALVSDPYTADLVLFVEYHPGHDPYFFEVLGHPLRQRHPDKCVLYTDADRIVPLMPTLGPSVEAWQNHRSLCRAFPYVTREYRNEALYAPAAPDAPRHHLFSFMGSSDTHPVRTRILALREPDGLLHDTGRQRGWLLVGPDKARYETRYFEACRDSHFILCPRGAGPSSYRLYEAMQLGRAPVVISDAWTPHDGPEWDSFCVRIRERDVDRIGEVLRARVAESRRMGMLARREWERWVAPEVALHRLVAAADDLRRTPRRWHHAAMRWGQFAHPFHLRNLGRWFFRIRRAKR